MRGAAVEVIERAGHRPAAPGQCRDRHRRLHRARQHGAPKVRSASGPATTPPAPQGAGARHQGDLPPQRRQSCWAVVPERPPDEDLPLSRDRALGAACARTSQKAGVPAVTAALGARGRQCAAPARCRHQPALSGPRRCRPGTSPAMCHVGAYVRALHHRGRRRHRRRPTSTRCCGRCSRARSGDLDRHHPQCLVDAA